MKPRIRLHLLLLAFLLLGGLLPAQWQTLGKGLDYRTFDIQGIDSIGLLYVCGGFTRAGDVNAHALATWDGSNWAAVVEDTSFAVCDGYCGEAYSFVWHEGDVFLSGVFAWNNPQFRYGHNAYRLDGAEWDSCGSPDFIPRFRSVGTQLFALGHLSEIGDSAVTNIALWDSPVWRRFGPSFPFPSGHSTAAITQYQGNYWVGGNFEIGNDFREIMYYDGTAWRSPIDGVAGDSWVDYLLPYKGLLYVGGYFSEASGNADENLMVWDGARWLPSFPNVHFVGQIRDLEEYGGDMYIVGNHHVWDGGAWRGPYALARYDGQEFCSFGGEGIQAVQIGFLNGDAYITTTQTLNWDTVNYIARWPQGSPDDICISQPLPVADAAVQGAIRLFPNPTHSALTLDLPLHSTATVEIHDLQGRTALPPQPCRDGERLDVSALPAGLYLLQVRQRGAQPQTIKFIKE